MSLPDRLRIGDRKIQCEFATSNGRRCRSAAESVDHITPQAIGRLLGWTEPEINSPDNLQRLCNRHHHAKDKDTQLRVAVLRAQLRGELVVGLGQHPQAFQRVALVESVDRSMRDRSKQERKRGKERARRCRQRAS